MGIVFICIHGNYVSFLWPMNASFINFGKNKFQMLEFEIMCNFSCESSSLMSKQSLYSHFNVSYKY